jgi:large subunit ribosomal protein L30
VAKLKITLSRSLIGRPVDQKATAKALGLTRMQQVVIQEDSPAIKGMIHKVEHLVTVESQD